MSSSDRFQFFKTSVSVCASVFRHMCVWKNTKILTGLWNLTLSNKRSHQQATAYVRLLAQYRVPTDFIHSDHFRSFFK